MQPLYLCLGSSEVVLPLVGLGALDPHVLLHCRKLPLNRRNPHPLLLARALQPLYLRLESRDLALRRLAFYPQCAFARHGPTQLQA